MEQFYYIFDGKKWDWMESNEDWAKKDIEEYNFELVTSAMTDEDKALAASKQSEKNLLAYFDFEYSDVVHYLEWGSSLTDPRGKTNVVARWCLQLCREQKLAIIMADTFKVEITAHPWEVEDNSNQYKYILAEGIHFSFPLHRYKLFDKIYNQYTLRLDYGKWTYTAVPNKKSRVRSNYNYYNVKHDWTDKGFNFSLEIPPAVVTRAIIFLKGLATEEFGFSPTVPDNMPGNKLLKYFVQYPMDVNVGLYVDMLGYDFGCQVLRKNDSNFDLVCDYLKLPKTKSLKKAYHANYAALAICYFLVRRIGIDDINILQYFLAGQTLLENDIDTFGIDRGGAIYFKKRRNGYFWFDWHLLYRWLLEKWGAKRTGEILSEALLKPLDRDKWDCLSLWRKDYEEDDLPAEFVQAIYRHGISKEAHDVRNMLIQQVNEQNNQLNEQNNRENEQRKKEIIVNKCNITFDLTQKELAREEETPEGIFKVARTGRDLYNISEKMRNCVFSCYTESMQSKNCTIYYLQKGEKYLACIEVRKRMVVQALGMCNSNLRGHLYKAVTSWCARHELIYGPWR